MSRYEHEKPQMKVYLGKKAGSVVLRSGREIKDEKLTLVEQPAYARVLKYTSSGELSTIEFSGGSVDIRALPQDKTIPKDAKLVKLFAAKGITTLFQEDLILV